MSLTASNTPVPFIDEVEQKECQIVTASGQALSTYVGDADQIEQYPRDDSSSSRTPPAPQAVLDALASLSPRKNAARLDLAPISTSQFENYTMAEQTTPVAFSFNLPHDRPLSPRSINTDLQTFPESDNDMGAVMCTAHVKTLCSSGLAHSTYLH